MIRTIRTIALAALAAMPAAAQDAPAPPRVLVVLAHPDDELTMAPALAALARQGARLTMIYATSGDQGPGVSGLERGPGLGKVRAQEALCAANALGADNKIFRDRGDGLLGVQAHHEQSAARRLAGELGELIPLAQMILTWGPDGGYGHADHRMVSALATQLVQAMPAEVRPKLLYVGIPAGTLPPVPEMARWATTDPALLTETIAYTPADLTAAKAAAQCHVTQFDDATRAGMMALFDATIWRGRVHFRPAF